MIREEAYHLLTNYLHNKNLIKHCLAAEASMKGIYKRLHMKDYDKKEEEEWGTTGLLHDVDYELAQNENQLDKHGLIIFEKEADIIPEPIAYAIKAHNYQNTQVQPKSDMDWAIATVDGLTGFIVAATLIHPGKKLKNITTDFVLKRYGEKAFAKGVDRSIIALCHSRLGIGLEDFITITLTTMQEISDELGL